MDEQIISRRGFLIRAGTLATGVMTVGLVGCAPKEIIKEVPVERIKEVTKEVPVEKIKEVTKEVPVEVVKEVAKALPKLPWPYKKLDPEIVRKRAHLGYYNGACCYGAFGAIMDTLKEQVGFPYTQVPSELMLYGETGFAGMGSLCGALNGAGAAINLLVDRDTWRKIIKELALWYSKAPFPSDLSNQYAKDHKFLVEKYKSDKVLTQSVANSTMCHVSVTKWCLASKFASGSDERSERCGRLTGDVAAQAVVYLNQFADTTTFKPVAKSAAVDAGCTVCHTTGKDYAIGNYIRGEEDCVVCHDPHPIKAPAK